MSMWRLLGRAVAPIAASVEGQQELQHELAGAQQMQEQIRQMIAQLAELGMEDTEQYGEVMSKYRELSHVIARAKHELKVMVDGQVHEQQALTDLDAHFDLAGI